ncbi:MAG TPA: protein-glutamate O-methyltransferase CheR [Desulfobacterales bacterium]|nr:protein-glutamate O-methyltransferase CheR [Desulfobacterales bacterium]
MQAGEITKMAMPVNDNIAINNEEFKLLRDLVYERFGINLTETKRDLVVSRLQNVLQLQDFDSFKSYYQYLITDRTNQGLNELINHISTNFSYFYRENAHFDFFSRQALPQLIEKLRQRNSYDIRLWTAGCSTGEEPYMLIMLMMEHLGLDYGNWDAGMLATDISERVLKTAAKALYPLDRIERVPAHIRQRYFKTAGNGMAAVSRKVKEDITLRRFNLMNPFPFKKPFQMIFCRNVMIYFDKPTRDRLIKRFHQILEPGGYLFIGHSESLGRTQKLYKYVIPACYQKLEVR